MPLTVLAQLGFGQNAALQLLDLLVQAEHHGKVDLDGQPLLGQQRHRLDVVVASALDLVAAGMGAQVGRN